MGSAYEYEDVMAIPSNEVAVASTGTGAVVYTSPAEVNVMGNASPNDELAAAAGV